MFTVPSAPQNLIANNITAEEVHLSWVSPLTYTLQPLPNNDIDLADTTETEPKKLEPQGDGPIDRVTDPVTEGIAPEKLKDFEYRPYDWYKTDKQKYNDQYSTSDILIDSCRTKRDLRTHRHRQRRQGDSTDRMLFNMESFEHMETHHAYEFPKEVVKKSMLQPKLQIDTTQIAYVLYYEQGVPRQDMNVSEVQTSDSVCRENIFPSDLGMQDYTKATKNLTLLNTSGRVTKVVGFRLKNLSEYF